MTRWLFGPTGLARVAELMQSRLLVVLDFDGTLAPIVADRERAQLQQSTRRLLADVARRFPVAVVSGPARADVARRLRGLRLAAVVGNHGAEKDPERPLPPCTRRWLARLERELGGLPGVEIEDKGHSLSVHFRRAPRRSTARVAIAAAVDQLPGARRVDGLCVVNVVPKSAPHKGTAVRALAKRLRAEAVLYVGDDVTDEDAFAAADAGWCTVRVGRSARTRAQFHLTDQREVDRLLSVLRRGRPARRARKAGVMMAATLSLLGCESKGQKPIAGEPAPQHPVSATASATAQPPARGPLNVLLLLIDSWRSDVSWTGYPRQTTPRIDAFRRKHCVAYANGYALSSTTAKSVVPALAGQYPSAMRRDAYFFTRYADKENLLISERARAAGHQTFSIQAHGYFHRRFLTHQGFDVHRLLPGGVDLDAVTSVTSEPLTHLIKDVLRDVPRAHPSQRFFAYAHYMDPHHTYEQHAGVPRFGRRARDLYDHEVLHTDRWVGELLEHAQKQDWWRDTAVIISADHGEGFGERKHNRHGHELWESIVRVPWLVCLPGVTPRVVTSVRRSQIDLAPTIADLMGLSPDPPFVGKSLVPEVLGQELPEPRRVVIDQPRSDLMDRRRAVIDGDLKLVAVGDDRAFFLFDLAADPWEAHDLAASRPDQLERMKRVYFEESKKIPLVEVERGPDLKGAPKGRRW